MPNVSNLIKIKQRPILKENNDALAPANNILNHIESVSESSAIRNAKKTFSTNMFSGLYANAGENCEKIKKGIEGILNHLTIPVGPNQVSLEARNSSEGRTEITLIWFEKSPAFQPLESERIIAEGEVVTVQFMADLNRSVYIVELPGDVRIKLDCNELKSINIEGILMGVFGKEHLRKISEIAHQGHMADFARLASLMEKNEYMIVSGSEYPKYLLKKEDSNDCKIISTKIFQVRSTENEKFVKYLTVEMQRKNTLLYDVKRRILTHNTKDEENGISIKIKYTVDNQCGLFSNSINNDKV